MAHPPSRPCRLFLFDLDGTLVDSQHDLASAVNAALADLGFGPLPVERVVAFVGHGVRRLLERTLGDVQGRCPDPALVDRGLESFRSAYAAHLLDSTRLYPGVREALDRLSWAEMAVVSNKPERYSRPILEGLGIARRFCAVIGEETAHAYKPDPAPLVAAMRTAGASPAETVMVGDSPVDIEAGRSAGVATCACTGGYHPEAALRACAPDLVIGSLPELGDLFHDARRRR